MNKVLGLLLILAIIAGAMAHGGNRDRRNRFRGARYERHGARNGKPVSAGDVDVFAHAFSLVDEVNANPKATWKAERNSRFEDATLATVKRLCGTDLKAEHAQKLAPQNVTYTAEEINALPVNFDSRKQWPACSARIGHIRDQSDCGSCWAFGSTEAFNDRMCIVSGGSFQTELSAQDTAACCSGLFCGFSDGCNGGQPSAAWSFFQSTGVVSGGDYGTPTNKSCWPYQLPTCDHHVNDPKYQNCSTLNGGNEYQIGQCTQTCGNGYPKTWNNDMHMAASAYSVGPDPTAIQMEIFKNGPVTAAFTVYADFPGYKSGVYQHLSGGELGGHAIKILGWGVENNTPYWLVANSWNSGWGDKGYFKILRGSDECGIEDDVSAGMAAQ